MRKLVESKKVGIPNQDREEGGGEMEGETPGTPGRGGSAGRLYGYLYCSDSFTLLYLRNKTLEFNTCVTYGTNSGPGA